MEQTVQKQRVAVYCCFSADSEEPSISCEAQKKRYTQKISENPDWEMAGFYADSKYDVDWEDAVMREEIFGPLLPILTYKNINDAWKMIEDRTRPLALYCFTENPLVKRQMLSRCRFGGRLYQ